MERTYSDILTLIILYPKNGVPRFASIIDIDVVNRVTDSFGTNTHFIEIRRLGQGSRVGCFPTPSPKCVAVFHNEKTHGLREDA